MRYIKRLFLLPFISLAFVAGFVLSSPAIEPPLTAFMDAPAATSVDSAAPLPEPTPSPAPTSTPAPQPAPTLYPPIAETRTSSLPATPTPLPLHIFEQISQESLFTYLTDLTAIQPYSGWRSSATEGESEALDYVAKTLNGFAYLQGLGLALERQQFRVPCSTELWETRVHLSLQDKEIEVPADGLRGHRDNIALALRCDSDGMVNDADRNPVVVEGPVVLIRSSADIYRLGPNELKDKIAFVDYAVLDQIVVGSQQQVGILASELLALRPAGLVLVTRFSNEQGSTHGAFVADASPTTWVEVETGIPVPPTLYVRTEDLFSMGIAGWEGLEQVKTARLTWDADIFAPGTSGNLVARIPGADPSKAVILGAHIDSPNSPGALDDGSGSVVLLEIARVLDITRIQPAVDLYLVWFGSEELGLYGSAHFASTHQDLLGRTLAMLQIDCLTRPLDGLDAKLILETWSYGRLGDDRLTWSDYLTEVARRHGVETIPENEYAFHSDNGVFTGFNVPNANMIYEGPGMKRFGPIHYAAHLHDPYDTVELAQDVRDVLEEMTRVALASALETGLEDPPLRVAPQPDLRALFVASHTEALMMTPIGFTDLGQTLAMAGYDVDLIPYGQPVTPANLEDTDLVVVLPVVDYPSQRADLSVYDEAWSAEEIETLEVYVADGGLLVLTNSAHRLKIGSSMVDVNEDWRSLNVLAERFGISYRFGTVFDKLFWVEKGSHPLVEGISCLSLLPGNAVPLKLNTGQVLAWAEGRVVMGLVDYGGAGGQVLALADVGLLGNDYGWPPSLELWQNLAEFARLR